MNLEFSQRFGLYRRGRENLERSPTKRKIDRIAYDAWEAKNAEKRAKSTQERPNKHLDEAILKKLLSEAGVPVTRRQVTIKNLIEYSTLKGIQYRKSANRDELIDNLRALMQQKLATVQVSQFPLLPLNNERLLLE